MIKQKRLGQRMIKTPMMLLLSGEDAKDKEFIKFSVEDIAKQGFDAVCLEFRDSKYNEHDDIGKAAIGYVADCCHNLGLGFVIIMHHCAEWILEKHPQLRRKAAKGYSFKSASTVQIPELRESKPTEIIEVYSVERDEAGAIKKCKSIADKAVFNKDTSIIEFERTYEEVLIYAAYVVSGADYANRDAGIILDEYLSIYKNYALDGFALDEFGAGTRIANAYLCSPDFLQMFEDKYGYNLLDKIYLLDNRSCDYEFAKVRYDYFELVHNVTLKYQLAAKHRYEELFGNDLFIGFHHTWYGEGNSGDLWSGAIDYFKLAEAMSGGFVDAQYDSERTMNSLGLIAESVAKYSPTRRAYNMCWDRTTTPDKMDYFHRTLAVRNINWVGHAYSKTFSKVDDLAWFIFDFDNLKDTWGDVPKCINREKVFSEFIGALESTPKVAITYNWESCAYFNNEYMHYHRLSLKALADKLIINNIPADIVPSYETNLSKYDVIFALWPTMMRREQWESIKEAVKSGKKVCFIGPPAKCLTDGTDITAEFEDITGANKLEIRQFFGGHEYVAWDLWFTDKRIKMQTFVDKNGKMCFKKGNVSYYAYELPLTDMFFNVLTEFAPYQTIKSDKVISKEYHSENEHILTVTSRWQSRINEKFTFEGFDFEINNGVLVGIKVKDGNLSIISERDAKIKVDGKVYCYEEI